MEEEAVTVCHESLFRLMAPLLSDVSNLPDVSLADKNTGVVNALGESKLEHLRLEPPLQEVLNFQTQDVIELHLTLIQHTDPHQTPEQGITWENKNHQNFKQNCNMQHI